jgi:membrane-associated protease RseP (regulator of RpoE activity)
VNVLAAPARPAAEEGQVAVEFLGTIFLVLLAALLAWQLALVGWSAVGAANAARTAARAYSRTSDASNARADAQKSLDGDGLGTGSSVSVTDGKASVVVKVPLVFPGLASPVALPAATASMPHTG